MKSKYVLVHNTHIIFLFSIKKSIMVWPKIYIYIIIFPGSSSRNRLVKNDSADEDSDVDGIPLDVQTPSSRRSVSNSSAK